MASNQNKKSSASKRSTQNSQRGNSENFRQYTEQESALFHEVALILLFAVTVILFLCNFGIIGTVGNAISAVLFGLFGFLAYLIAIAAFIGAAFWSANQGNPAAIRKLAAACVLFILAGIICELISGNPSAPEYSVGEIYRYSSENRAGGGVIAGSLAYMLVHFLDMIGTVLVVLILGIISAVLLTERSFVDSVKNGGRRMAELSREDAERRREQARIRRNDYEEARQRKDEERARRDEERRLKAEEKENERILRMDKKVTGVMADTSLTAPIDKKGRDDIHEITLNEENLTDFDNIRINGGTMESEPEEHYEDVREIYAQEEEEPVSEFEPYEEEQPIYREATIRMSSLGGGEKPTVQSVHSTDDYPPIQSRSVQPMPMQSQIMQKDEPAYQPAATVRPVARPAAVPNAESGDSRMTEEIQAAEKKAPKKYIFPPLSRLQKGQGGGGDSAKELKETAYRLQQTLNTFGVKVSITDISQGPAVTRYELQPEQGVKVSKIVGLADDIKLNLAATDIRIEAPIPGKAAIGIEVPNKENTAVALRDLLESNEFKEFSSNLAFAVGKDIAGKVVVADIAKMPHMLIAGATGSGKSVCINTLIMSILYKAHPDDVKLIMVDPKVVELSVYNGIPHLLIPVVTDPKKASAALHWGVSEMTDRYKKFADFNVRDLKGYNQKVESMKERGEEDAPAKMPQIVIIVDELADLMMVAPGEVEESICRLAQLARAAGIHLIIATQRPSVDVITGLIKANMPSRVAFSVSSGVDSRTILDMNGAEKLLGKGDMLFYPQGYTKPARVQGAFVSDKEVSDVVDFLKNQTLGNVYAEDIEEKIMNMGSGSSAGGASGEGGSALDEYFADAGRFIIDKDKASIGMFQRMFKIGFNRAARIMDQLYEYGVVGEEEGTKPRKVLMSMEQFEQLLEEI
ncbi:MAG: DNA translocase FtsK 4TM domain-containing protein [Lachnospiraceae bacterium]|nr:DNA translocase FtsK 4TM domain-containing protein [Lachnospiraceae bacterium]